MAIEFNQLNTNEQQKVIDQAMEWFYKHKNHIYSLILPNTNKIAPSGSDMFHPELWKAVHWKWFLDKNFLL